MTNEEKIKHPSFGQISVTRMSSGHGRHLYGSNMDHHNTICIHLHHGYKIRHLNTDWHCTDKLITEIEMTPHQWAEFISSVGLSDGVPCTIRFLDDEYLDLPEETPVRETFETEFRESISKASEKITTAINRWNELNDKKTLNMKDRQEIAKLLNQIQCNLNDTMPFIQTMFNESMDKTVHAAKSELEAWQINMLQTLGERVMKQSCLESAPTLKLPEK